MKNNTKYCQASLPLITQQNIDAAASELNAISNKKLKNGCLSGKLSGYEPDIRQTAILMAMRWWLDHQNRDSDGWNPKRSMSYALNYAKLQLIEKIERRSESTYNDDWDVRKTEHPYRLHAHDYPEKSLLLMFETILNKCLGSGTISNSNALIARMSYCEGKTLEEIASTLGIHRSAVNQQLRRVRLAVSHEAKTTDPIL